LIEILKALADETRLRILSQVLKGEMCVCEIEACLELTQSNASRHLMALKKAGILESYKKAQWTYYRLNETFVGQHKLLHDYLIVEISRLPSYVKDSESYDKCRQQDLCKCKRPSESEQEQNNDKEAFDNE